MRPISRAHSPAQFTTKSAAIAPLSVSTPVTRPPVWRMPVTFVFSKMRTPRWRAPLASAWVMLAGSAWPLAGIHRPPVTPARSSSGNLARASAGDSM